jgi:hypothetical protein
MRSSTFMIGIAGILSLILLASLPVSAASGMADLNSPSINVSVMPASPGVGDIVTISGMATGGNLTPGVRLWIFAGNYVNVTDVLVNSSGYYEKNINTTGYPPAYYYIFVQHPGSDNKFNINVSGYSGEVIDDNTGAVIFNFTGNGSLQDNAAAVALSNALNQKGVDDLFAKAGVTLRAPGQSAALPGGQSPLQATLVTGNASPLNQTPLTTLSVLPSTVTTQSTVTPGAVTSLPVTTRAALPIELIAGSIFSAVILTGIFKRTQ